MANISIVNYCNLKCPYCFANDMITENNYTITIEELNKILEFCSKTQESVGVIGGEPTLHPNFTEILITLKEYRLLNMDRPICIYSNGIELEQYTDIEDFYKYFNLLLNINHPDIMTSEQYSKILKTLDKINKDTAFKYGTTIGCNFYLSRKDYQYIWDIVKKYNIKFLRVSVVAPSKQYQYCKEKKEEYYTKMKEIFIDQCKIAEKYNMQILLDCNNIPFCYYNNDEIKLLKSLKATNSCRVFGSDCNIFNSPIVDIMFGYRVSACFGAYDIIDPSLFDFNDIEEVKRYLKLNKVYPKIVKNGTGKCATCKQYELSQCQGGCLGFVK